MPEQIRGTAFFPGGYGLWNPGGFANPPDFPFGKSMVVGHDFHSEAGYERSLAAGCESAAQPTWRNLVALLKEAQMPLSDCFFTNFFMGLRCGTRSTGRFLGAANCDYVKACSEFFIEQVAKQRPAVIVTLGATVPKLVAVLSDELKPWQTCRGFKDIDGKQKSLVTKVRFSGVTGYRATVVALTHPSFRLQNMHRRSYRDFNGHMAEVELLREAIRS